MISSLPPIHRVLNLLLIKNRTSIGLENIAPVLAEEACGLVELLVDAIRLLVMSEGISSGVIDRLNVLDIVYIWRLRP